MVLEHANKFHELISKSRLNSMAQCSIDLVGFGTHAECSVCSLSKHIHCPSDSLDGLVFKRFVAKAEHVVLARVMLLRYNGASIWVKSLRRLLFSKMTSFSGTSSLATDSMKSLGALLAKVP